MRRIFAVTFLAMGLAGCATFSTEPVPHLRVETSRLNDPLEARVRISTLNYMRPGILSTGKSDPFLRGYYDKATGVTSLQVYIANRSSDWQRWKTVAFDAKDGLKEVDVYPIGTPDEDSDWVEWKKETVCSHFENVGFDVTESELSTWAGRAEPLTLRVLSGTTAGEHHHVQLPPEEVSAFLEELARVREAMGSS